MNNIKISLQEVQNCQKQIENLKQIEEQIEEHSKHKQI